MTSQALFSPHADSVQNFLWCDFFGFSLIYRNGTEKPKQKKTDKAARKLQKRNKTTPGVTTRRQADLISQAQLDNAQNQQEEDTEKNS